jgi:hypothetical protein
VLTLQHWGHVTLLIHRATPDAHVSSDCVLQGKDQRRMAGTIDLLKEGSYWLVLCSRIVGNHQLIHLCFTWSRDKLELGLQSTAEEHEEQHIYA